MERSRRRPGNGGERTRRGQKITRYLLLYGNAVGHSPTLPECISTYHWFQPGSKVTTIIYEQKNLIAVLTW